MHEGRITAEFDRADATEDAIMRAATGQAAEAAA
jgi:rhamnose transport system ATP-binding protein